MNWSRAGGALALLALAACMDTREPVAPGVSPAPPSRLLVTVPGAYTQIDAGYFHDCARRSDGIAECWGYNADGQAPAVKTPAVGTYDTVVSEGFHSCGLRSDGVVECWGGSVPYDGQAPAQRAATSGVFVALGLGTHHTCGVRSDGKLECWGAYTDVFYPIGPVPELKAAATGTFTQVAGGASFTCALRSDGAVECWGFNSYGQAPSLKVPAVGAFTQISAGKRYHMCALRSDGVVECWGNNSWGQTPPARSAAVGAYKQVAAGTYHSCALRTDGVAECWGSNSRGQAPPTRAAAGSVFTALAAGDEYTCGLRQDGTAECWGFSDAGAAPAAKMPYSTTDHVFPTATLVAPTQATAGQPFSLLLTDAKVPGHPEASSFTYAFDCGDGSGYGTPGTTNATSCPTSAAGTRAARAKVIDQDGDATPYEASVVVADPTPPSITPDVVGTPGKNGWYTSDVTVTWAVSDGESVVTESSGCGPSTIGGDTPSVTLTCTATSGGGTASHSVTVKRDATPPTLGPQVSPNPAYLNGTATASPNATDATSGVASASCGAVTTATVGTKSVACTATDAAGNSASMHATYAVIWPFSGFDGTIHNPPALNAANAGSGNPLRFSLGGDYGTQVIAAGSPVVFPVSCATLAPTGARVPAVTPGGTGLLYAAQTQVYTYLWKTEKTWAGSCRAFEMTLVDGTKHLVYFQFR